MTPTPIMRFHAGLKKHFAIDSHKARAEFLCPIHLMRKEVRIDLIKFDDWLHEKHGQYEDDGLSMEEAIDKFYSVEASAFIKHLI